MSFNWNNVKPACCAKWLVLPTVYSDALSYGEQLDKFCYQLNKLIENNNILPDFIAEMIKEYINSGAIGEVVRDILADYILNVKYPPNGIKPAVGDGSADDTLAIQGCIDYAAENGGVVYFPYGSYLTQPLTMKDGVSLFGFDRYSTKIVLKGGATKPLIGGTVADFSVANLTLDGNSGIQVNNVNVVTLMATNVLFANLIIKDGYTLVNYVGTGGHFQISDVVFGNAVEKCLLTTGNADVQCENVVFNQLSAVGGISVMDIGTDGGFFNVKSLATCNQCIVVTGNNNKISAIVKNAAIPIVDNGLQNNIEIFGISNKEFYYADTTKEINGSYSKNVGGTYTKEIDGNATETYKNNKTVTGTNEVKNLSGKKSVSAGSLDETISGKKSVTANSLDETVENDKVITAITVTENTKNKTETNTGDYFLDTTNPVKYGEVTPINSVFGKVPWRDKTGKPYSVLTAEDETLLLGSMPDVRLFGAKGDGVADDSEAFALSLKTQGCALVPSGTFKVNVVLESNQSIIGVGDCSILTVAKSGESVISTKDLSHGTIIKNIHVIGDKDSNGIRISKSSGFTIDTVYVESAFNGIYIDGKTIGYGKLTHINNCYVYKCYSCGIFSNNYDDLLITNTECVSCSMNGNNIGFNVLIQNGAFKMIGCHFWNQNDTYGLGRPQASVRLYNCGDFEISNCHIEGGYTVNMIIDNCQGSIVNSLIYATFGSSSIMYSAQNCNFIGCKFFGQASDEVDYKPEFVSVFSLGEIKTYTNLIGCIFGAPLFDTNKPLYWQIIGCKNDTSYDIINECDLTSYVSCISSNSAIRYTNIPNMYTGTNVRDSELTWIGVDTTLTGEWYAGCKHYVYNSSDSNITITANYKAQKFNFTIPSYKMVMLVGTSNAIYMIGG